MIVDAPDCQSKATDKTAISAKLAPSNEEFVLFGRKKHPFTLEQLAIGGLVLVECAAIVTGRQGTLIQLAEKMAPAVEEGTMGLRAGVMRLSNAAPRLNYYKMQDGLELQFAKDVNVFGLRKDMISITHPTAGEAHLISDGSRIVSRPGIGNFYDEAGKGIHMAFPDYRYPSVQLPNPGTAQVNLKSFRNLENCFLLGSMKQLEKVPNLFEQFSSYE